MLRQPKQQDVAAAIAAARAALKPAVDAGAFSNDPPKRLSKFFLKFAMTSLANHRGSSWGESEFHYDDDGAGPVIAKAIAGDIEADVVLREIARSRSREGLPPNLAIYLADQKPDQRGNPGKFDRDVIVYFAIEGIRRGRFNFNPTRNTESKRKRQESASSIVVKALRELGVILPEKTVERIWLRIHRSTPAGSVLT